MSQVVGIRKVEAKATKIKYVELHLLSDDRFVEGHRCETIFVREDMISHIECLSLGVFCKVIYNRNGRVDSVEIQIDQSAAEL